jgi:hypothetical protein
MGPGLPMGPSLKTPSITGGLIAIRRSIAGAS